MIVTVLGYHKHKPAPPGYSHWGNKDKLVIGDSPNRL